MKKPDTLLFEESAQFWADYCALNYVTYSFEENEPQVYFNEWPSHSQYNYWDWFVIPNELIILPITKTSFIPRFIKSHNIKSKPLLFSKRTIVPLRI